MPYVEDGNAWPTMVKLAACLCTEITERGLPEPCDCGIVPGPMAVMDSCGSCSGTLSSSCGGQAWVRMVNEFPSTTFPQPSQDANNCWSSMAYVLEVGIARCLPQPRVNSITGISAPDKEANIEATRLQMADKAAMLAAIRCCLGDSEDEPTYMVGSYTPMQATGDCGGGFWTVTIWTE